MCRLGKPQTAWAIKWVLMFDEVSCVIPGASRPEQVTANIRASELDDISPDTMAGVEKIYSDMIKPDVHHLW